MAAVNALPAIATECPPIKVRPGAEAMFFYGEGKVGDPRELQYQAVIDQQSRNCVVSNGLITVKMGVGGRVLLGPEGNETDASTVPLRFAVERDNVAGLHRALRDAGRDHPAQPVGRFRQGRRERRDPLPRRRDDHHLGRLRPAG